MLRKSYFIKVFLFCMDATCTERVRERTLLMLFKSHTLIHIVRAAFYPPMKLVWWQFHVKLASQTNYKNRMHRMNNIMVNLTTWYKHTNAWERVCVCVCDKYVYNGVLHWMRITATTLWSCPCPYSYPIFYASLCAWS